MFEDADLVQLRRAIAAYFRAAGALAEASVLARLAATASSTTPDAGEGASDEVWLLDRATTYRDKAQHMSKSGAVLLDHVWDWTQDLDEVALQDEDALFAAFARAVEDAASGYAAVVDALTETPLNEHPAYQDLLQELRHAVRFLQMEAAALDELEDKAQP